MIDINKKYRTRDGHEIRIYAMDGGLAPVHGAIKVSGGWLQHSWHLDGRDGYGHDSSDLIEVKPRIRRTVWLNVYDDKFVGLYHNRENADEDIKYLPSSFNRLACVKVEIDVEEGEGL